MMLPPNIPIGGGIGSVLGSPGFPPGSFGSDTGPGPQRHPKPLTAADLHLQLEREQEAVVCAIKYLSFQLVPQPADVRHRSTASPASLLPFVLNNPPTTSMNPSKRPLEAPLSYTIPTLLPTYPTATVPTPILLHQPLVEQSDPTLSLARIPPDQYVAPTPAAGAPLPPAIYFLFHHTHHLPRPWEAVQARTHMAVTTDTSIKAASALPPRRQMGVK